MPKPYDFSYRVRKINARTKGHAWERKILSYIREIDPDAKRNLEYDVGSGFDIQTNLPLTIQCKCGKSHNWIGAIRQAINAAPKGNIPLAAIKVDYYGEYALLPWESFWELFKKYYKMYKDYK